MAFSTTTFTFQVLSPTHIGGGSPLSQFEWIVLDNCLYVVDEEKLARFFVECDLLDEWCDFALSPPRGELSPLTFFLRNKRLLNSDSLESIRRYSCELNSAPGAKDTVRPFVRDGFGNPYVPGSSLKGALRVAILYALLKRLPAEGGKRLVEEFVQRRLDELTKEQRRRRRIKFSFAAALERRVLQAYNLVPYDKIFGPRSDLLRALEVSDSVTLPPDGLQVEEVKVYSFRKKEPEKPAWVECLPAGMRFQARLGIDAALLEDFGRRNSHPQFGLPFTEIREILLRPFAAMAEFTRDLLVYERLFFAEQLRRDGALNFVEEPNFRLGWGGGLLGTTIDLLLGEEIRKQLRNAIFVQREAPAPKTRRLTQSGAPLGWIKVEETKETADGGKQIPGFTGEV